MFLAHTDSATVGAGMHLKPEMEEMMNLHSTGTGFMLWQAHWILALITWILIIIFLVVLIRWVWKKGGEQ